MSFESKPAAPAPAFIWWILWAGISAGLAMVYFGVADRARPAADASAEVIPYLIAALLFASAVVRWLVLPRIIIRRIALPVFVMGLALAEAGGLFAVLLLLANRDAFVALAFLGLAQYAPVFLSRFEA